MHMNMNMLPTLILPLLILALIAFAIRRSLRQMKSLPAERQIVMKRAMGSGAVGTLSIMSAAAAYLLWSYNRNLLLMFVMTLGVAGFVASVIWAGRLAHQWSELVLRKKQRST
jgi:hypothetical protein